MKLVRLCLEDYVEVFSLLNQRSTTSPGKARGGALTAGASPDPKKETVKNELSLS